MPVGAGIDPLSMNLSISSKGEKRDGQYEPEMAFIIAKFNHAGPAEHYVA
jgi:hypothetical protein